MWKEKNKTHEGAIKKERERKEKENKTHTERGKKNGYLIFLLSLGGKREILKLILDAINCLMKHYK